MKFHAGLAFPQADEFMVRELACDGTYQIAHLTEALRHVTNFSCAVDAGAHIGTWSTVMARQFQRVVAFEPSPDTFACLEWNLTHAGLTHVERHHAALGAAPGSVSMHLDALNEARANTGARFAKPGGDIPVITLDSLALQEVGFLKLDIEGSELFALQGATDTLLRCRPIVLFEDKRLWTRHFGLPKDAVARFLLARGYHHLARVSMDEIWGPRCTS